MSTEEVAASLEQHAEEKAQLTERIADLTHRLDWLQNQLFGEKSERRLTPDESRQLSLGETLEPVEIEAASETAVEGHRRRKKSLPEDERRLRFDETVPIRDIFLEHKEAEKLDPSEYTLVSHKTSSRLMQKPSTYEVVRYHRPVIKRKSDGGFMTAPLPDDVLEGCIADVSVLANTLVDKFVYHLPLYRQHERMQAGGVHISRTTQMTWGQRSIELLTAIYLSQHESVLQSDVLAMDETPIKAGRKTKDRAKGKMKTGYFWPIFGDRQEISFVFANSRATRVIHEALADFQGTLLTDGYGAYERFVRDTDGAKRAQCWSHARRKFVEAEASEPELVAEALDRIGELYEYEEHLREQQLDGETALLYRTEHEKPVVDAFFEWLATQLHERVLLPSSPFTKAANYALDRKEALRVFLEDPAVPLDTNHLEREIRPIALGRKNWLFCWTELGAHQVAIVQSLLRTCKLHGIDPYTYLVDVLQRVSRHPASKVHELTPRLWKEHFAGKPMKDGIGRLEEMLQSGMARDSLD